MPTLLRIDSSSRKTGSHSSALANRVEAQWLNAHPTGEVRRRHLAFEPITIISQETIAGFYASPEAMIDDPRAATALSDRLIAELQAADTLLIAAPIYNFSVPAALKAWIDQITRIDRIFAYRDGAFAGLLNIRRAIVACAYGAEGYLDGGPFSAADFLEPYLRFLLSFLGIESIEIVGVEATTAGVKTVAARAAKAEARIAALFAAQDQDLRRDAVFA